MAVSPLAAAEPERALRVSDIKEMSAAQLGWLFDGGVVPNIEELAGGVVGHGLFPPSENDACAPCGAWVRAFLESPLILWSGKRFDRQPDGRWVGRNLFFASPEGHAAFPMRPAIARSPASRRMVLRLDYRVEGNPPVMQRVYDEVVQVGPGLWLGRAYFRGTGGPGTDTAWLWFALEKTK